jgi:hypothetical protein
MWTSAASGREGRHLISGGDEQVRKQLSGILPPLGHLLDAKREGNCFSPDFIAYQMIDGLPEI